MPRSAVVKWLTAVCAVIAGVLVLTDGRVALGVVLLVVAVAFSVDAARTPRAGD